MKSSGHLFVLNFKNPGHTLGSMKRCKTYAAAVVCIVLMFILYRKLKFLLRAHITYLRPHRFLSRSLVWKLFIYHVQHRCYLSFIISNIPERTSQFAECVVVARLLFKRTVVLVISVVVGWLWTRIGGFIPHWHTVNSIPLPPQIPLDTLVPPV